jgi:hypothetical protein
MIGMPEGVRKLLVAYDVEGYGGRGKRQELATQQRLVDVLKYAFGEAGLPVEAYEIQEQGDGGLALLPTGTGVDEPRVIRTLIDAFDTALGDINEELIASANMRLRVAFDEGVVHRAAHGFAGPAVTAVCRLRDAMVVKEMLKRSSGDLIVVVADHLYQDVLMHERVRSRAFDRVEVKAKEFVATAWFYLPGDTAATSAPESGVESDPPPRPSSDSSERTRVPQLEEALKTDPGVW